MENSVTTTDFGYIGKLDILQYVGPATNADIVYLMLVGKQHSKHWYHIQLVSFVDGKQQPQDIFCCYYMGDTISTFSTEEIGTKNFHGITNYFFVLRKAAELQYALEHDMHAVVIDLFRHNLNDAVRHIVEIGFLPKW